MEIKQIISDAQKNGTWLAFRRAAAEIKKASNANSFKLDKTCRVAFLSSFTIEPLVDFITVQSADSEIGLDAYVVPYGQISQEILNAKSSLYAFNPEMSFLIAEPQSLAHSPLDAANELIILVESFKQNSSGILVLATFIASPGWPMHILPSVSQVQLSQANEQLYMHFSDDPRVQICDLNLLAAYHGYANAFSPEMMAMARIPFAEGFLRLLAEKLLSHLKIQAGLIRKCLVLDCDNTLWGGIIGEDGIDGIKLGPDWPGREFVNFQKAILELFDQGVILAINSKNNEADVMQVLKEHPHMVLRENHFAAICANWNPKPDNIKAIAQQINIGIDALVFVDDNPVERDLMKQMVPEVAVLDLPDNPALFEQTLRQTSYFTKSTLTEEDKKRGQIYAAQRKRVELEKSALSLDDYLKSLEMICTIRQAETSDIKRAAQLTQRTNQFNLTTRRYTETEIEGLMNHSDWNVYVLALKDKFGDNGTVGLAIVEKQSDIWRIDTFLMSCRIIGRQAENALLDQICRDAVEQDIRQLTAEYIKTQKNSIVSNFWSEQGFTKTESIEQAVAYQLDCSAYQPKTFEYFMLIKSMQNK